MDILNRRRRRITALVAGLCIVSTALWAGGSGFGDDDDAGEDEGPSYFGFVKDGSGATVPGAQVTVAGKDRGGVVTRTEALGAYKVLDGHGRLRIGNSGAGGILHEAEIGGAFVLTR